MQHRSLVQHFFLRALDIGFGLVVARSRDGGTQNHRRRCGARSEPADADHRHVTVQRLGGYGAPVCEQSQEREVEILFCGAGGGSADGFRHAPADQVKEGEVREGGVVEEQGEAAQVSFFGGI